jgi:hypothetical protein
MYVAVGSSSHQSTILFTPFSLSSSLGNRRKKTGSLNKWSGANSYTLTKKASGALNSYEILSLTKDW